MAIELVKTQKIRDDCYSVTVRDTETVIGTDELGVNIYKTYSLIYNPINDADALKTRIEELIGATKTFDSDEATVTTAIKTTVEAIDTSKILVAVKG